MRTLAIGIPDATRTAVGSKTVDETLAHARSLIAAYDEELAALLPAEAALFDAHVHVGRDIDGFAAPYDHLVSFLERYGFKRAFAFCMDEPDRHPAFQAPNDRTLEAAERSNGLLIPFVRLDLAEDPIEEARRCLDLGARGIKLHPRAQRFLLNDERLTPVFSLAAERRVPILIHGGRGLPPIAGPLSRLVEAYPEAQLIIAHGGRRERDGKGSPSRSPSLGSTTTSPWRRRSSGRVNPTRSAFWASRSTRARKGTATSRSASGSRSSCRVPATSGASRLKPMKPIERSSAASPSGSSTSPISSPPRPLLELAVNGDRYQLNVPATRTLAEVLREDVGLTGTKIACGEGDCGACTVMLDGLPTLSCITLAHTVGGRDVTTIEGLRGHPLLNAFVRADALQCGFCTPGQIVSAAALVAHNPSPSKDEIRHELAGNLCRCGAYPKIEEAVLAWRA